MSLEQTKRKAKRCKICSESFVPVRAIQPTCLNFDCQVAYANKVSRKGIAERLKTERKNDRERKEKLKTRSDYMKEAQIAFNAYIRERDKDKPCICCGKSLLLDAIGGGFDCGHYRSVGSAPHLRFDERNANGQRKQCNRYGSGRAVDYRLGLIKRIGIESVMEIEADNEPKHYTIEELKEIKAMYKQKLRELKNKCEHKQY